MAPDKIGPTVGQNSTFLPLLFPSLPIPDHSSLLAAKLINPIVGKISLPSTTLRFFDLGGQASIRSIWEKYYDECHAVVFVLDSADQARLSEAWEVFGECDNKERRERTV